MSSVKIETKVANTLTNPMITAKIRVASPPKSKLGLLLVLKRAIALKTSYVLAFGKLLVFVDQKYHTLENIVTKRQKLD